MSAGNPLPALSVGLAVRNDPQRVRRCIESVLSQDFTDIELVICDNASDDETLVRRAVRAGRQADPVQIGVWPRTWNRVFELSRGRLFRWISADDWLEPHAISEGVRTLERHPDALGVTSGFTIHAPGEAPRFEHYSGEFPGSSDPSRRFERMLWFFHAGDGKQRPRYGIYRREQLLRSGRMRPSERADWLLSAELALMGPILHVPDLLAHRTSARMVGVDRAAFRCRSDGRGELLKTSPERAPPCALRARTVGTVNYEQVHRCRRALRRFWLYEVKRTTRMRASDSRYRVRSLTHGRPPHS